MQPFHTLRTLHTLLTLPALPALPALASAASLALTVAVHAAPQIAPGAYRIDVNGSVRTLCADEIAKAKIMHADSPVSPWLTLSIGAVSMVAAQDKPPESLVRKADLALYSAKATGRARYEVADLEISTQLGELATH